MMLDSTREIKNAIVAGNEAFNQFNQALMYLDKAQKIGFADLLGGGLFISIWKMNRIKKANECIEKAKQALVILNDNIDSDSIDDFKIDTDGLLALTDMIINNPISDGIIQVKIGNTIEEINDCMDKIESVIDALERSL